MILIISTTERYNLQIGLLDENKQIGLNILDFETQNQSADLLPSIKQVLAKNNLNLSDLSAILINLGPGSYTGVRVGVTTANTLAWSLDIPVFGFPDGEIEKSVKTLKINNAKFSKPVLPLYK